MYIKRVEADAGGYNPYNPTEDWNKIIYEETVHGKKYQVLQVVTVDYIDKHAEDLIQSMQNRFDSIRNKGTKNEKRN